VQKAAEAELLVNSQPVAEAALRSGDRIVAGGTVFLIEIEGAPTQTTRSPSAAAPRGESLFSEHSPAPSPVAEIAARAVISKEGRSLLRAGQTSEEVVNALLAHGLAADAVKFRSAELSPSDAVRWSAQCVRRALDAGHEPREVEALDAAEKWAEDPTEPNRRAAEAAALALDFDGPAAFVALAAFWSGDNLAPEGLPPAPVPKGLSIQGAAGAVLLAAPRLGPEKFAQTLREFLDAAKSKAATPPD
jgi:hypothetical protein